MSEVRYIAEAIPYEKLGGPEIVINEEQWSNTDWEPTVIQRATWPNNDDGDPQDADKILEEMGWIAPRGWERSLFGYYALVERW